MSVNHHSSDAQEDKNLGSKVRGLTIGLIAAAVFGAIAHEGFKSNALIADFYKATDDKKLEMVLAGDIRFRCNSITVIPKSEAEFKRVEANIHCAAATRYF